MYGPSSERHSVVCYLFLLKIRHFMRFDLFKLVFVTSYSWAILKVTFRLSHGTVFGTEGPLSPLSPLHFLLIGTRHTLSSASGMRGQISPFQLPEQ